MIKSYGVFAEFYDVLTANIDYKKRALYFDELIKRARRWRRGRRHGNLSRWPTSSRSSGRMRSCAIRRHAGAAAASGSAQHLLRLSYVGCPLEQIPEGISCIDREIDWLLEQEAALEI